MSVDEVLRWPVVLDVPTAGRPWGLSKQGAWRLARHGRFPVEVQRVGRRMFVNRSSVLAALGVDPGASLASAPSPQVRDTAGDAQSAGVSA